LLLAEKFGIIGLERAWGSGVEIGHHFFLFCALGRRVNAKCYIAGSIIVELWYGNNY
jgi:hypothetical protein